MKAVFVAMALAAIVSVAMPADAEPMDLATLKCRAFLTNSKENVGLILMWLEGYYTEENASPVLDLDRLKDRLTKFNEYCGKNPDQTVINAADAVMGK